MTCLIKWNTQSIEDWEEKFSRIPKSNILQSYTYARAMAPLQKQRVRWGLIEIDGTEAGLVQMFEASFFWNRFHALIIDRGPLWFEGFGSALHVKRFFDELNRQFPKRFGRKRRILPETEDGPTAQKLIAQTGLHPHGKGHRTIWLDLTKSRKDLYENLSPVWREDLEIARAADYLIEWDRTGTHLSWLVGIYAANKAVHPHGGPPPELLRKYGPLLAARRDLLIGRAMKNGQAEAFVLLVQHGRSATYLAGWPLAEGPKGAAHHLLLWEGILVLQEKGIKEVDLGGVNDDSAMHNTFKEGLGGRDVRYVGHFN